MLVFVTTLFLTAASAQSKDQPEWYVCQKDSDCGIAKSICDLPKAVNKKYSKALAKHVRALPAECTSKPIVIQPERAACMNSYCQLILKTE